MKIIFYIKIDMPTLNKFYFVIILFLLLIGFYITASPAKDLKAMFCGINKGCVFSAQSETWKN
jgi:hypothetical protein